MFERKWNIGWWIIDVSVVGKVFPEGQTHENIDWVADQACYYLPTLFCIVTLKSLPHWMACIYACIFPFDCRLPSIMLDTEQEVFVVFNLLRICKSSVKKLNWIKIRLGTLSTPHPPFPYWCELLVGNRRHHFFRFSLGLGPFLPEVSSLTLNEAGS